MKVKWKIELDNYIKEFLMQSPFWQEYALENVFIYFVTPEI